MLKKGDKVKLIAKRYNDSVTNPIWNESQGRIVGTITLANYKNVYVEWNNGKSNSYSPDDLKPFFKTVKEANSYYLKKLYGEKI